MSEGIKRIYVEKKTEFAVEARALLTDLQHNLGLQALTNLRILNRYDVIGLSASEFEQACRYVFSEPPVDLITFEKLETNQEDTVFAIELLPGQYDQREDFSEQCIQLITQKDRPIVSHAKVFILSGVLTPKEVETIKEYCINPIEAREAAKEKPLTLENICEEPQAVARITGFNDFDSEAMDAFRQEQGFAMSLADLLFCQKYFQGEDRPPSITELKVLDTYWSDHCRHTTFNTELTDITIEPGQFNEPIQHAYDTYLKTREDIYGENSERKITLMDIAVNAMKKLRKDGKLEALDVSEEINACSIVVPVKVNGETEEWLVMFKNETHNHPTEIEPFGGAATCLGGAIRDPLSGRAYVYQAMRVTGAADPRKHITETLPGKLPQRKITLGAAAGYSSYGNQIGLATGHVQEYYHDDFVAKRMELGAVIGAVPRKNVYRTEPQPGDVIILLGGRTGRDGCGGATGSSKEHTSDSLLDCAAEVQKGNPPTERKIQRLFRNPEVTLMIKRCNDFGAGGVSVACGELTDGLVINLDKVPKKYEGLDGTELAISESQERMALVIAADNVDKFIALADKENLEATVVSEVTEKRRLEMYWRGDKIVDLSRDFLDTNGLPQMAEAIVKEVGATSAFDTLPTEVAGAQNIEEAWYKNLGRLNVCSQKGLAERFDSTIGRGTVLMPFGGRYQLTPTEGMVATIPVLNGTTTTATVMSCGYNPHVAVWSPFHGAMYAIVESVARAVACGGNPANLYLTLQEFFPKLAQAETWGQPVSAVLGAFLTMMELDIAAIGGKDSMSGTFMDKNVPPTLVSFAVSTLESENALSPEFKQAGDNVVFIAPPRDVHEVIDFKVFKDILDVLHKGIVEKKILAISVVKEGGIAAALSAMCLGNKLGFEFIKPFNDTDSLFALQPGGFIVELAPGLTPEDALVDSEYIYLGTVTNEQAIYLNETKLELTLLEKTYLTTLDDVFPRQVKTTAVNKTKVDFDFIVPELPLTAPYNIASPKVFIPVFPGINCEYDTAAAFTAAGGKPEIMVVRNLTPQAIDESIAYMVNAIKNSQILALPGGFSAGDEPDGSGKFIATMLRNEYIKEAVHELLYQRDGLIIGICNGFQALIKLGLVPYGEIVDMKSDSPTLTFNTIGRHISQIVQTKVVSTKSPWLNLVEPGDIHSVAVSHGEGRFFATEAEIKHLFANGQIATQYVDQNGQPALEMPYNPNGSLYSIEGITSPDGRVFGKMGHTERYVPGLMKNIAGNKDQKIFLSGVKYFE